MARKIFFSFKYEDDVWRANQVKNSWVAQGKEAVNFIATIETSGYVLYRGRII